MLKTLLQHWAERDQQEEARNRHGILLASLVLLLIMAPLFRPLPGGELRFQVLFCLVLTAAIYFNSTERWILIPSILTGGAALACFAIARATGAIAAQIAGDSLGLGLLSFTTLFMLNTLMKTQRVSRDTIIGGICVYMLIGLCFALGYILVIDLGAGALIEAGQPIARTLEGGSDRSLTILYFSFVTLTTLGYGDIAPIGETARMLASTEAIVGQLYIAIFIARLISQRQD